jgi:hypothetical protein
MTTQSRLTILLMTVTLAAIVLLIGLVSKPTTAQDQAAQEMHALLERLTGSGASITVLFDRPLVSGEGVWTLPDEAAKRTISTIGADFVCFSEPWNTTTRERCTPFANITSISYVTP